jgi:uncharacterized Rossmann fold enzyme
VYRKDINLGGWFSFNSTQEQWKSFYAEKMLNHFFDGNTIRRNFQGIHLTNEFLITKNLNFAAMQGKKVLVIGGGPSTTALNNEMLKEYDYVFSCNHFYRNSFLKNIKVDVVLLGDEVDLNDGEFRSYVREFSPIMGFEHSSRRSTMDLVRFKRNYAKSFVFLTRYFSRLGYVARACVLAKLMGAHHIDFIGLDGFKSKNHSFESSKPPPPFNDEEEFKKQMKVFCSYMVNDLAVPVFNNLSENSKDSIYTGILAGVKNEKK